MAVLYALWTVAFLTMVTVSFSSSANNSYRLARNNLDAAKSDALVEAALSWTVLGLIETRPEMQLSNGSRNLTFDGTLIRISIQDELGRIDLNHADGPLLVGLFQSAGMDPQSAAALIDKILDWRDAGPLKRLHGAKDAEYKAAGLPYRPRNAPFQSVDELRLVLGMTAELYERVEPALTVHSGRQLIDPQLAPPAALLALPGMDRPKVAAIVAARSNQATHYGWTPNALSGAVDGQHALNGRAFTIRIEIEKAGSRLTRETAVRLTGDPAHPFWVLGMAKK